MGIRSTPPQKTHKNPQTQQHKKLFNMKSSKENIESENEIFSYLGEMNYLTCNVQNISNSPIPNLCWKGEISLPPLYPEWVWGSLKSSQDKGNVYQVMLQQPQWVYFNLCHPKKWPRYVQLRLPSCQRQGLGTGTGARS